MGTTFGTFKNWEDAEIELRNCGWLLLKQLTEELKNGEKAFTRKLNGCKLETLVAIPQIDGRIRIVY